MGLEMTVIVIETEKAFGIAIPDDAILGISTVGQYYDYIVSKLEKEELTWPADEVWTKLKLIIADELAVDPEKVTKDARFVADLGAG